LDNHGAIRKRILGDLRKHPKGLTITDIASDIDVNRNTTARYLDVMQMAGQVEMRKVGPAKLYTLSQRVPLDAMLNIADDGILTFDSDLKVIRINSSFVSSLEIEPDDVLGRRLDELCLPGLSEDWILSLMSDAAMGKESDFNTSIERNDGIGYFRVKLVPTTFYDGTSGATMILEDVTKRRLAEQEVERQRDFLHRVMESVQHPFYVIDAKDYSVKLANSASQLGDLRQDTKCYTLTHGRSSPCSGDVHPCPLQKVKEEKKPITVEHIHHQISGPTRHLDVHAHPIFDEEGNVDQVVEYCLDITDRKQLELDIRRLLELYQMTAEKVGVGVFVVQDKQVIYCNPLLAKALGYRVHEFTDVPLEKMVDSKHYELMLNTMEKLENQTNLRCEFRMKNGQYTQVRLTLAPSTYLDEPAYVITLRQDTSLDQSE
jgi:PAS domain S-box-containing protein